jgi:cell filamentation protein
MASAANAGDYDAIADPYRYSETTVLKNIPGIRNRNDLAEFEAVATAQRADEPLPGGRLSVRHYKAIHHHLFQDAYPWAGKFRTVRLSKGGSAFCYPENIVREMNVLFGALKGQHYLTALSPDRFAEAAAHFLSTLNAIHPYREGNGRTQTTFLMLLGERAGHPLGLDHFVPERFLVAMVQSFQGDKHALVAEVRKLVS